MQRGNQVCNQFIENNLLAHTFGCETVSDSAYRQVILVFYKICYSALEYMAIGLFYKDYHLVGSIKLPLKELNIKEYIHTHSNISLYYTYI